MAEALTASALLAVSLGVVFDAIIDGRRMVQDAASRSLAMRVAQDITERERTRSYATLSNVAEVAVPDAPGMTAEVVVTPETFTGGGMSYSVRNVETRIRYRYRGATTVLRVTMVRAP